MKTISDKDVKFLLKDSRATGSTLIYLIYRYGSTRFKYSTEQTIEPYLWDTTTQRAITDPKKAGAKRERQRLETVNAHLERHKIATLSILANLSRGRVAFDNATLKQELDTELGKEVKVSKPVEVKPTRETFTAYIARFVKEGDSGKRLNAKSMRYSPNTLKGYSKLKRLLENYHTETKRPIDFDDITLDLYKHLKQWLTGKDYSHNYIGSLFKDAKILLKQAYDDRLHTNLIFTNREFRKFSEETDSIYLTTDELKRLYYLDLASTPGIDRARDLFLIGAFTGLRFSDFTQLRAENIVHNGRMLSCRTQKTAERVSVPLNGYVRAILAKNGGIPPKTITNQRLNDHLKELGKRAGLTERVEITTTKGGKRGTTYPEKWALISTHTARRSFATNAYLAKIPMPEIMKVTGHRTEAMFLKYVKVSSEQNALMLMDHPHFADMDIVIPMQTGMPTIAVSTLQIAS